MPGTLQLVQVGRAPIRIQTFLVQNDEFMLVNPDIVNSIYIGNDPGSQLIAVPALGSVTLDAKKHDIWVSTSGGNYIVNAYLMPNGSNWVPSPAQVAAQINALGLATESTLQNTNAGIAGVDTTLGIPAQTQDVANLTTGGNPGGIPVLRGTDNLGNATAQIIAPSTNTTLISTASITKPGFEAIFQLYLPSGAGTLPFAALQMQWLDGFTGLLVGQKYYELTSGNGPATPITCYISGPTRGNQLTVKLLNRDTGQNLTATWALNQTSHAYAIDRQLQPTYATTAPIGYTNPGGDPKKGLLASISVSIPANGNISRLLAASNAKIKVGIDNTVQLNSCALLINTPATTGIYSEQGPPATLLRLTAGVGAQSSQEWQLPNGPTVAQIFNQGGTNAIQPNISILTMEY